MAATGASKRNSAPNPEYRQLPISKSGYSSFNDFYPFYLGEHHHPINRRLHLLGTSISAFAATRVLVSALPAILTPLALRSSPHSSARSLALRLQPLTLSKPYLVLLAGIVQGYVWAWFGHFFFEHNKPATFKYPLYSFQGDLRMLWEVVTLRRKA